MEDIYAALMGDPISEEEKMRALAKKMAVQRSMGQTGQILGGRLLEKPATQMVNTADAQAEKFSDISKNRYNQQVNQDLAAQAQAERRSQFEEEMKFNREKEKNDLSYKYASLGQQAADRALARTLAARDKAERDAEKAALAAEKDDNVALQRIANNLQKDNLPGLFGAAEQINTTLAGYKDKEIPSIGRIDSMKPDWALGAEGQMLRADLAGFANQLLRLRSGAAVTDPEARRFLQEIATGKGIDEKVFRERWPKIMEILEREQNNILVPLDDRRKQLYFDRGGTQFKATNPFAKAEDGVTVLR